MDHPAVAARLLRSPCGFLLKHRHGMAAPHRQLACYRQAEYAAADHYHVPQL
jgi:hypothetical protein